MSRTKMVLAGLFVFSVLIMPAEAEIVTFKATGYAIGRTPSLVNIFPLGTPMEVVYTFDSSSAKTPPGSPFYNGAIVAMTVKVGGYTATATTGNILVFNDNPYDAYVVQSFDLTGPTISVGTARVFSFSLQGGDPLSSDAIPILPPQFNTVGDNTFGWQLEFRDASDNFTGSVSGNYTSFFPQYSVFTLSLLGDTVPTGSNVTTTPSTTLPDGSTTTVSLTFENVLTSGNTTITTAPTGPPPPSGFKLASPPVYYEISTTATFSGSIRVCLNWTEGQIKNENNVHLFHNENSAWIDITDQSSIDTVKNTVCGMTTSLSPFTMAEITYPFAGFFQPIDNLPVTNSLKAGAAVPVKFSLGGFLGLNIFANGYPRVQLMQCVAGAPVDAIEETVNAGGSTLAFDTGTGRYIYIWKTDKAWAGSCGQLQLGLSDGEVYVARFMFSR